MQVSGLLRSSQVLSRETVALAGNMEANGNTNMSTNYVANVAAAPMLPITIATVQKAGYLGACKKYINDLYKNIIIIHHIIVIS